ncbi:uncharacterized protein DUF4440 [Herbihabitans rhizosphaerae]|uniref:Uncharacterized protein DUF4440 n=1 Tax=Herbihabitans rhizosphaerae TaxID=1872711 RepID=A0A4Q7KFB8_9PSEU|nr:nuclear transport factor 2 family protein [Herbihabitans rhizosphaerae]RZS31231.1 uncharacterized protein DUF4440 [Herbihabitans rhizosphaerae]
MTEDLVAIEKRRVQSLLDVDADGYDQLHADDYRLCNPTGTVWTKTEYLDRLRTGGLTYRRLEPLGDIDVLADGDLAVLRYRCLIELRVDGADIPAHEAWHTDVYRRAGDSWRCVWSQATGIMATVTG